jgi:hypothetical protein
MFPFTKAGRADAVEQFLGRAHDQHPPILAQAQARCPPGRREVFLALGGQGIWLTTIWTFAGSFGPGRAGLAGRQWNWMVVTWICLFRTHCRERRWEAQR